MSAKVTWDQHPGEVSLLAAQNLAVVFLSEKAFPPGARPTGVLHVASAHPFQVKIHGSRAVEGGRFEVRGTLLNATVAVREAFRDAVLPPPC